MRLSGIAPQLTLIKGASFLGDAKWIALVITNDDRIWYYACS